MKLRKVNPTLDHDGATIEFLPRNLRTITKLQSIDSGKILDVCKLLIVSWSGVTDENGVDVEFSQDALEEVHGDDAEAITKKILKEYGIEADQEKN